MNSVWDILSSFWCIAFTFLFFIIIKVIGKQAREVEQLKRKAALHEDMIVQLSNQVTMCTDYLNDNCMFCMHNMEPVREEENKE